MNDRTEKKHRRHDGDCGNVGIKAKKGRHGPGAVHSQHKEFAMREIHDAQDAKNERQTHAHQSIDAADEYAGKDELTEGAHADEGPLKRPAGTAPPRAATISGCSTPAAEP